MLRVVLRACMLAGLVGVFLARGRVPRNDLELRRNTIRTSRYSRLAARVLGIRLTSEGRRERRPDGGVLLVANHLSWIDPMLMAAHRPAVFVTSVETSEDGFLGRICALSGCVFMERRKRDGLRGECAHLARLLAGGDVVVFPEATSSNGSRLLPFRPACFASALSSGAPVQPAALHYASIDGQPAVGRRRDRVCWYGDMTFLPHLAQLMTIGRIAVEIAFLPPVTADGGCRKTLAVRAHAAIATRLGLYAPRVRDRRRSTASESAAA